MIGMLWNLHKDAQLLKVAAQVAATDNNKKQVHHHARREQFVPLEIPACPLAKACACKSFNRFVSCKSAHHLMFDGSPAMRVLFANDFSFFHATKSA